MDSTTSIERAASSLSLAEPIVVVLAWTPAWTQARDVEGAWSTLRLASRDAPILIVSEGISLEDKLRAFSSGADDCVVLPCAPEELVARVQVLFRRTARPSAIRAGLHSVSAPQWRVLRWEGLSLDLLQQVAVYESSRIELRPSQFKLLCYLIRNARRVVPKSEIQQEVLGVASQEGSSNVRNLIWELRRQLGPAGHLIQCVRGVGYGVGLGHLPECSLSPHPRQSAT